MMKRSLNRKKAAIEFSNAVLRTVGCDGSYSPYVLLELIHERLTDGEAGKLLADLQTKGRDMHRWKPEFIASLIVQDWEQREIEREQYQMEVLRDHPRPKMAMKYMPPPLGYDECVAIVAGRISRSIDQVKRHLRKIDSVQLERIKQR